MLFPGTPGETRTRIRCIKGALLGQFSYGSAEGVHTLACTRVSQLCTPRI